MYPIKIMRYIYRIVILSALGLSLAMLRGGAAEKEALDTANIRVGCWVEYKVTVEESPGEMLGFSCFIKLYGVAGEMLDFDYKIDGIGKRISISRRDFPLLRLLPKINRSTSYKESTEEIVVLQDMDNRKVKTIHDLWNYENGVIETWHSPEVPFSLVRVECRGFIMELRAFSWAEE